MINPFKDIQWKPDVHERRKFGRSLIIGFPILAVLFALLDWWRSGQVGMFPVWVGLIGAGAGVLFVLVPWLAKPFYVVWFFLACCIGIVVSNLLLAVFFYLVVTPTALVLRMIGRDRLHRRLEADRATYWRDIENTGDPKDYYRQF